ncbi:hypothetical protein WISP_95190 [Willisornis vidua]|uniref:Uncharacterized protein n=1 Tax=Willisornis vidua TaxID=1566151 RepID=A0ABQ9CZZ5_9PASS|nr:hypothetical protein WISP_95190 [Willisornis vidua]
MLTIRGMVIDVEHDINKSNKSINQSNEILVTGSRSAHLLTSVVQSKEEGISGITLHGSTHVAGASCEWPCGEVMIAFSSPSPRLTVSSPLVGDAVPDGPDLKHIDHHG